MPYKFFKGALLFIGGVLCWFSFGGLRDLMPSAWAIPLAFANTTLFSIVCYQAGASRGFKARVGFGLLALPMWVVVSLSDGLSFAEILSREGGDRFNATTREARARFSEVQLERLVADREELQKAADLLLAEIVAAEMAASPAAISALEAELNRELRTGAGPRSREIDARLEQRRQQALSAAGNRARHQALLEQVSALNTAIEKARPEVRESLTEAAVAEDTRHYIFSLASAYAGQDRNKTSAFLSGAGAAYFGILELVYGCLCAVAAHRKFRVPRSEGTGSDRSSPSENIRKKPAVPGGNIIPLSPEDGQPAGHSPRKRCSEKDTLSRSDPFPAKHRKDASRPGPSGGRGRTTRIPDEIRAQCRILRESGMAAPQIAKKTGISIRSVYRFSRTLEGNEVSLAA